MSKRFADSSVITTGNTLGKNLSGSDKVPFQHTSGLDNADYVATVAQLQAVPYGVCSTAGSENAKTVSLENYPADYTPQVGSKVIVKFTNANSSTSQITLLVGTQSSGVKCTCRGVAMSGACFSAGAILEFAYTGEVWNCQ